MNVLLMAYGTPYSPEEIEPYYTDIRRGRKPPEELLKELSERYAAIGKSPLNEITLAQGIRLQALLNLEAPAYPKRLLGPFPPRTPQGPARVYIGTKHWHHSRHAGGRRAEGRGHRGRAPLLPKERGGIPGEGPRSGPGPAPAHGVRLGGKLLRPSGSHRRLRPQAGGGHLEAQGPQAGGLRLHRPLHPPLGGGAGRPLPKGTAERIALRVNLPRFQVAYQSAGRTPEPWLGPDINELLQTLKEEGVEEVVVQAVGFPADHLEVFYDLDLEAQATAERLGLRLLRARGLNADLDYIQVLKDLVEAAWQRS